MLDWMRNGYSLDERRDFINMLNYFQILILALIQGACELLPVSVRRTSSRRKNS